MESQPKPVEVQQRQQLEVPYVTVAKAVTRERIPEQAENFEKFFDAINNELMGNGEGKGLFIWESKKYPGVKFLAGQIHITEKLVRHLSHGRIEEPINGQERRLSHLVRFFEPGWGLKGDGSGVSVLDMALSPALDMTHIIATAIKNGEIPPTGDIFLLGSPAAIGGETTPAFNKTVKEAIAQGKGFDPYGEIYAEFMEEHLPTTPDELDKTKIVLEGVSEGTITADRTAHHLREGLKPRKVKDEDGRERWVGVQVLLDNPAGIHGSNLPTQIGRSGNMLGFVTEAVVRNFTSPIAKILNSTQPQFYKDIAQKLKIPQPDETQRKAKKRLAVLEITTLLHGAPLDKRERAYVRISSPDPANANFKGLRRAFGFGRQDKPRTIQDWVISEGETKIFPNSNKLHMWPWLRSIESGAWGRKMKAIVDTESPK